jgi:hypothetical protein
MKKATGPRVRATGHEEGPRALDLTARILPSPRAGRLRAHLSEAGPGEGRHAHGHAIARVRPAAWRERRAPGTGKAKSTAPSPWREDRSWSR